MKVLVRGNQVLVQTDISKEDFIAYKGYGAFTVMNQEDQVYKVSFKEENFGSMSPWGATCDTTYQGKLAAAITVAGDMEGFLEDMKPALLALKENELIIAGQVNEIKNRLEGLEDHIVIED